MTWRPRKPQTLSTEERERAYAVQVALDMHKECNRCHRFLPVTAYGKWGRRWCVGCDIERHANRGQASGLSRRARGTVARIGPVPLSGAA